MKMEILLRSSWQTVNIGDIAHTPGLLTLLEKYIPEATVTVWASGDITPEVLNMEKKRFPHVRFVKGDIGDREVSDAIKRADFFFTVRARLLWERVKCVCLPKIPIKAAVFSVLHTDMTAKQRSS